MWPVLTVFAVLFCFIAVNVLGLICSDLVGILLLLCNVKPVFLMLHPCFLLSYLLLMNKYYKNQYVVDNTL